MSNGHGGRRPGAGRKPGQRNKRTIYGLSSAGEFGDRPQEFLAECMENPEAPWPCRVAAAIHLDNRRHGKPPIAIDLTRRLQDMTVEEIRDFRARYVLAATPRISAKPDTADT